MLNLWCVDCISSLRFASSLWEIVDQRMFGVETVSIHNLQAFLKVSDDWYDLADRLSRFYDGKYSILTLRLDGSILTRIQASVFKLGNGLCVTHALRDQRLLY